MPGLATAAFSSYAADAFPQAPALSRWLARGHGMPPPGGLMSSIEAAVRQRLPGDARLAYLHDHRREAASACLHLDPVHLRADARGLTLYDASTFAFSREESRELAADLQPLLEEQGWRLWAGHPQRWYLEGEGPLRLESAPLAEVRGRAIGDFLPAGEDAARWLKLLNELQMRMHDHPVNRRRGERRLPAVNSLWLWGGGDLRSPSTEDARVYSDRPVVRGLAERIGLPSEAVPANAGQVRSAGSERVVVVLEDCDAAAAYGDFHRWHEGVSACERNWFVPLLSELRKGGIRALELLPGNGRCYRLRRHELWRFWRRERAFPDGWS